MQSGKSMVAQARPKGGGQRRRGPAGRRASGGGMAPRRAGWLAAALAASLGAAAEPPRGEGARRSLPEFLGNAPRDVLAAMRDSGCRPIRGFYDSPAVERPPFVYIRRPFMAFVCERAGPRGAPGYKLVVTHPGRSPLPGCPGEADLGGAKPGGLSLASSGPYDAREDGEGLLSARKGLGEAAKGLKEDPWLVALSVEDRGGGSGKFRFLCLPPGLQASSMGRLLRPRPRFHQRSLPERLGAAPLYILRRMRESGCRPVRGFYDHSGYDWALPPFAWMRSPSGERLGHAFTCETVDERGAVDGYRLVVESTSEESPFRPCPRVIEPSHFMRIPSFLGGPLGPAFSEDGELEMGANAYSCQRGYWREDCRVGCGMHGDGATPAERRAWEAAHAARAARAEADALSRLRPPPPLAPAPGGQPSAAAAAGARAAPGGDRLAEKDNRRDVGDGPWKALYPDGALRERGAYLAGAAEGPWERFHPNGRLRERGAYRGGRKEGAWERFLEDGRLEERGGYRRGAAHGPWERFFRGVGAARFDPVDPDYAERGRYEDGYREGPWERSWGWRAERGSYRKGYKDGLWEMLWQFGRKERYRDGRLHGPQERWRSSPGGASQLSRLTHYRDDLKDGPHMEFHYNGKVQVRGRHERGRRVGLWETFRDNGRLRYRGSYENGYRVGLWEEADWDGRRVLGISRGSYENGHRTGLWKRFHENGRVGARGRYERGRETGLWESFHENGRLHDRGNYENGSKTGLWEHFHENGRLSARGSYEDGRGQGLWEWFHANGRLLQRGGFEGGRRAGSWEGFGEDGQALWRGGFEDGSPAGVWEGFRAGGRPLWRGGFEEGSPAGAWEALGEDGGPFWRGDFEDGVAEGLWEWPRWGWGLPDDAVWKPPAVHY